eukprot:gene11090-12085_t
MTPARALVFHERFCHDVRSRSEHYLQIDQTKHTSSQTFCFSPDGRSAKAERLSSYLSLDRNFSFVNTDQQFIDAFNEATLLTRTLLSVKEKDFLRSQTF